MQVTFPCKFTFVPSMASGLRQTVRCDTEEDFEKVWAKWWESGCRIPYTVTDLKGRKMK